ncbi:MAG TPA: SHOCT domain-containing protein [Solirubrobacterales bacterium]|jgi:ABC-type multidrug transport system fused ATPase/permease subunit
MILADYTFGQGLLTVLEIFLFAAWLMVLFTIFADLFRDHEMSGWGKAAWVLFLVFVPFLAALIYLIARGSGMRDRALQQQQAAQRELDAYVRETAGGGSAADELTKLAKLHDEKKISDQEFERAKAKIVG